jgi:hypothetical protein
MKTQSTMPETALSIDHVTAALTAAYPQAAAGVSGFTVRAARSREGGHGIVVRHVDFDHDIALPAIRDMTVLLAIRDYAALLTRAGFRLQDLTRDDGLRDGLLILGVTW